MCSASQWHRRRWVGASLLLAACFNKPARGIIVLGGRDANGNLNNSGRNLNPAPFSLDSYEGTWLSDAVGTPIAPHYFVTAAHVGGGFGYTFTFQGVGYTTVAEAIQNDVAVWEVDPSGPAFPTVAPLYRSPTETGNPLIAIGRGVDRGPVVTVNGTDRGWQWGTGGDGVFTWGSNTASGTFSDSSGQYLTFPFTRKTDGSGNVTNPDTGGVAQGDSGGGTFVLDPADNTWKLAGVIAGAEGPYQVVGSSGSFNATLFDARGLYDYQQGGVVADSGSPVPSNSYSSRIYSNLDFIDSTAGLPEPTGIVPLGMAAMLLRRRHRAARLKSIPSAKTVAPAAAK